MSPLRNKLLLYAFLLIGSLAEFAGCAPKPLIQNSPDTPPMILMPASIRYYSIITYPDTEHISSILKFTYKKLSQVDSRNDSQMIFYDQVIPGSVLLGYLNADHWAIAVPINRSHSFINSNFIDKNEFPREVLLEAVVRYIEEDLNRK